MDEGRAFRADLRKDPEGTIKATGLTLDEDQWKAVRFDRLEFVQRGMISSREYIFD